MKRLSVIGLGKLGACAAACFSSTGHHVTGVDINKEFVDAINNGRAPVEEPGLDDLLSSSQGRLVATQDYGAAVRDSDITFLIVPTPSKEDGGFSDRYLKDALEHLSAAFREIDKDYHVFVVTSTVSPGTTEKELVPLIESVSGKQLGVDFGVCYNPEFAALGSVVNDFLHPDVVLIGESDKQAGDLVAGAYQETCKNDPAVARMSIVSAEITKISLNSYVTTKISFANTIANLCEKIPGADIDDITSALGSDRRIGKYYLKGGLGYGGPCFPRDNRAFAAFAGEYGIDARLAMATDDVNIMQTERLAKRVQKILASVDHKVVSVLGAAYKPNTPVIEESPAIALMEQLTNDDIEVIVYDPIALDNVRAHFGERIMYASSVEDCLANSSVCIVMTPLDEFREINEAMIVNDPTVIVDCWRIADPERLGSKVKYIALGKWCEGL